jgi:uncharacterized protein YjbI with pentapeptide repeats
MWYSMQRHKYSKEGTAMANEEHLDILKQGVEEWNKWGEENPDTRPDISKADLREADLREAKFLFANLGMALLGGADLRGADLRGANLSGATLDGAILIMAILIMADLSDASLSDATVGGTMFGDVGLSTVKGLDTVKHEGPSTIGINTVYHSKSDIPGVFLSGCGVSNDMIAYIRSIADQPG